MNAAIGFFTTSCLAQVILIEGRNGLLDALPDFPELELTCPHCVAHPL